MNYTNIVFNVKNDLKGSDKAPVFIEESKYFHCVK